MNLTPTSIKTINILINKAKTGNESNVKSLWNNFLPILNINIENGYISTEYNVRYIDGNNDKVDIVVINTSQNDKITLIIKCKSFVNDNPIDWDISIKQLYNNLLDFNCNYGIIAIGHKFKFVIQNGSFITLQEYDYDWDNDINIIYQIINNFFKKANKYRSRNKNTENKKQSQILCITKYDFYFILIHIFIISKIKNLIKLKSKYNIFYIDYVTMVYFMFGFFID